MTLSTQEILKATTETKRKPWYSINLFLPGVDDDDGWTILNRVMRAYDAEIESYDCYYSGLMTVKFPSYQHAEDAVSEDEGFFQQNLNRKTEDYWEVEASNYGPEKALEALNGPMKKLADKMLFWVNDKWEPYIIRNARNLLDERTDIFTTTSDNEAQELFHKLRRISDKVELNEREKNHLFHRQLKQEMWEAA